MFVFPTNIFNPANIRCELQGRVIDGGPALSGDEDRISIDGGGFWVAQLSGITLYNDDLKRAWRAWTAHLDGGAARCIVPIADIGLAPRPTAGGRLARPSGLLPTSGDTYFPEAKSFQHPLIVATIGAAALRATVVSVNIVRGSRLRGGEHFSLDHAGSGRRMYRVARVASQSGQQATVEIRPPLREAVASGTSADFDWASFTAKQVVDADAGISLQGLQFSEAQITFREAF